MGEETEAVESIPHG